MWSRDLHHLACDSQRRFRYQKWSVGTESVRRGVFNKNLDCICWVGWAEAPSTQEESSINAAAFSSPAQQFNTNLVDPASSHMLVSKIKPCMSQYKLLYGKTANGSLKQL